MSRSESQFCFWFDALRPVSYNSCAMTQTELEEKRKKMVYSLLFVIIGQVGFITLVVLFALVWGGVWLDNYFGTKPAITFVLSLAGIPLSVFLMFVASRRALARFTEQYEAEKKKNSA